MGAEDTREGEGLDMGFLITFHDCTPACPWQVIHVMDKGTPVTVCGELYGQADAMHLSTVVSAIVLEAFEDHSADPDDKWLEGMDYDAEPDTYKIGNWTRYLDDEGIEPKAGRRLHGAIEFEPLNQSTDEDTEESE